MKNLYIPTIRDELVLAQDWSFSVYQEYRNRGLIAYLDPAYSGSFYPHGEWVKDPRTCIQTFRYSPLSWPCTLPAGTKLIVDRVYLRNGREEFDSITFRTLIGKKKFRFWARLDDVNTMVIE